MVQSTAALLAELRSIAGTENVLDDPAAQVRLLKDFHWYSPLLESAFNQTRADAVVRPGSRDELAAIVHASVRHRAPITMRGAGTGNYGQSVPLDRGVVIDIRRLNRVTHVGSGWATVEAGTVLDDIESAARKAGQEMAVMSTTYHVATAAGFIAGGSGGIGGVMNGRLWDRNVLGARILTAEDPPRVLDLRGDDVTPVLHTYGTVGVITDVTFRLVGARDWTDWYATFDSFTDAARFSWALAEDRTLAKRLCSLQEAPIPTMFEPVKTLFTPRDSAVLMILDGESVERTRRLASLHGGVMQPWPEKSAINQFPFSHSILWSKKYDPSSTWLQCEFAREPEAFFDQLAKVKGRFGDVWLHHVEYSRLSDGTLRPSGIPVITDSDPATIDAAVQFCTEIGMGVMNPHSYVVQEGGMVDEIQRVLAFKQQVDPYRLLNPGKLERKFYTATIDATKGAA